MAAAAGPDRLPFGDPNWGWEFIWEDFVHARITDLETAAATLPPGPARDAALTRSGALRTLLVEHSIYVSRDGHNWGRCYTCSPAHGIPCSTIIALAHTWPDHPDKPDSTWWRPANEVNGLHRDVAEHGTFRRLRDHLADAEGGPAS